MTPAQYKPVDVLVIGAGNAAANAALAAYEQGASVAMLETAPESARGGNSAFTGGASALFTTASTNCLPWRRTLPTWTWRTSISALTPKASISTTWAA